MQTQLIEIVPDVASPEESWGDWAARTAKENPWKTAGVATGAVAFAPVGAALVGAGLGLQWLRGSDKIGNVELSKAAILQDEQGLPVQANRIYAVHPDDSRQNLVILASEFYNVIIAEQIADLVAFIRSTVRAASINIEVYSEKNVSGGFFSNIGLGAKAQAGVIKQHSVELEYQDPEIVPLEAVPFWLKLFPEITAAFRGAQRGTAKRSMSVDTSFGLSASSASKAGIDVSYLGKQRFDISAKFV